jgi:hypothetical protein
MFNLTNAIINALDAETERRDRDYTTPIVKAQYSLEFAADALDRGDVSAALQHIADAQAQLPKARLAAINAEG